MKRSFSKNYERLKKHRLVHKSSSTSSSGSDITPDLTDDESRVVLNKSPDDHSIEDTDAISFGPQSDIESTLTHATGPPSVSSSEDSADEDTPATTIESDSDSDSYYSYDSSSPEDVSSDEEEPDLLGIFNNPIHDLREKLKLWSVANNITLKALTQLLVLLRAWLLRFCILINWLNFLPKDARTLLGTNKKRYNVRPMECQRGVAGEFVYFGLTDGLRDRVKEKYFPDPVIYLSFNIDGIPLFKSSSISFWPILCQIFDKKYEFRPFPVAIFCGPGKPASVDEYLKDFVQELTLLINDGITLDNQHYAVNILCYICDTPARSFVKLTVGHGGFYCCERCQVKGLTINRKRVYTETDCTLRTEESFLSQSQEDHHTGISPLTRIPGFLPIKSFILDYMHLLCLGVMKRMLVFYWFASAKKKVGVTLLHHQAERFSQILEELKKYKPFEFPRAPRGLGELARFKATEYRFILLYCGPIALKNLLRKDLFKHFLILHSASRILCSPKLCVSLSEYAKDLFKHFFVLLPKYYGDDCQIGNMHNLIHIADDVISFKHSLDMLSAFPFENELGKMKRRLRTPVNPLAQYCRRMNETAISPPVLRTVSKPIIKKACDGSISKVKYLSFVISIHKPNNLVLMKDGQIMEIANIVVNKENKLFIRGKVWQEKKDIFTFPCQSSRLQEWEISDLSASEETSKIEEIEAKLLYITLQRKGKETNYAISILHSHA